MSTFGMKNLLDELEIPSLLQIYGDCSVWEYHLHHHFGDTLHGGLVVYHAQYEQYFPTLPHHFCLLKLFRGGIHNCTWSLPILIQERASLVRGGSGN